MCNGRARGHASDDRRFLTERRRRQPGGDPARGRGHGRACRPGAAPDVPRRERLLRRRVRGAEPAGGRDRQAAARPARRHHRVAPATVERFRARARCTRSYEPATARHRGRRSGPPTANPSRRRSPRSTRSAGREHDRAGRASWPVRSPRARRPSTTRSARSRAWLGANTKYSLERAAVVVTAATSSTTSCSTRGSVGASRSRAASWCWRAASGIPARLVDGFRARRARRADGPIRRARARTRTHGPRSTSPASDGRVSTRPRRCPRGRGEDRRLVCCPTCAVTRCRSRSSRPARDPARARRSPWIVVDGPAPARAPRVVERAHAAPARARRAQGRPCPGTGGDAARVRDMPSPNALGDDRLAAVGATLDARGLLGRTARPRRRVRPPDAVLTSLL